ncbi:hypothetical protein [Cellulomonas palmilytica]|uniref:hypothetical protein n=1 Tax=Cellulomonas palmilytica TaxID=2608402 RepID=UPI001F27DE2D|nr:hypothetical protein [Cellulomonas palmilytica]UJP41219.1 hypothetical protein F1D97_07215 [Cellulomonas palmilytica]
MQPLTPQTLLRALLSFVLGLVIGALGTVVHRGAIPWGLLAALALVLAATVMVRAWAGWPAYVGIVGGVFLAVVVLAQTGPGGDVLLPGGDRVNAPWLGFAWLGGVVVVLALGALAPRRWFDDTPRPPRAAAPVTPPPAQQEGAASTDGPAAADA